MQIGKVSIGRGALGGIVRALEITTGLSPGQLSIEVTRALGTMVGKGTAYLVIAHELEFVFRLLQQFDQQLDRLGAEGGRRRELQRQAEAIALQLQLQSNELDMPPMWSRDP